MSILNKLIKFAGRSPDGTAKAIATNQEGNLLIKITDNNVTQNSLDVYNRSVLDASQDSVAISGGLANSLARKPEDIKVISGKAIMGSNQKLYLVNSDSYIKIVHFEYGFIDSSPSAIRLFPNFKDKLGEKFAYPILYWHHINKTLSNDIFVTPFSLPDWEGLPEGLKLEGYEDIGSRRNCFGTPFVKSVVQEGETIFNKVFMRPNSLPIECPTGAEWYLYNNKAEEMEVVYSLIYQVMPV